MNSTAYQIGYAIGTALVFVFPLLVVIAIILNHRYKKRADAEAQARAQAFAQLQAQHAWQAQQQAAYEQAQKRAAYEARLSDLSQRFGPQNAERIMRGEIWQGATAEMLIESIGLPVDMDERIMKTKARHVYKYRRLGANRYGLRVTLENGVVVGWEEKG